MGRRIALSLAFRDMWQSSCHVFPSVSLLKMMAHDIIAMGCFDRVETNGGAFEQVCLMQGENPNVAVREFAGILHEAGIKTQMLERGLNALSLTPVSADVRMLMFEVKAAQGVDVARSFCGLNDHRNLRLSIEYAKASGMISQVAFPIALSPVHTVDYYMQFVTSVVGYGCDEICVKDMSGQGDPYFISKLIHSIKSVYPSVFIQYHSHCCSCSSRESLLAAVRAGADCVDVALGPLAGGFSHPDVLEVVDWLRADGFVVKDVEMAAYRNLVHLIQDFLSGVSSSLSSGMMAANGLHSSGLPGGMMASLMRELPSYHSAVNQTLSVSSELTFEQFVDCFVDEVKRVWSSFGYPPMVTPYSQYVANSALTNLLSLAKGQPRWSGLGVDVWNMLLGRMGELPGKPDHDLVAMAEGRGFEFYSGDPQELYPDTLERYREMMLAEGWSLGLDEEELLEFAMHENQYRDYVVKLNGFGSSLSVRVAPCDGAVCAAIAIALHEYLNTKYRVAK